MFRQFEEQSRRDEQLVKENRAAEKIDMAVFKPDLLNGEYMHVDETPVRTTQRIMLGKKGKNKGAVAQPQYKKDKLNFQKRTQLAFFVIQCSCMKQRQQAEYIHITNGCQQLKFTVYSKQEIQVENNEFFRQVSAQLERLDYLISNHHPAIIQRDDFDRVQAEIKRCSNVVTDEKGVVGRKATHYSSKRKTPHDPHDSSLG